MLFTGTIKMAQILGNVADRGFNQIAGQVYGGWIFPRARKHRGALKKIFGIKYLSMG
jgi:hypothetical protein